MVSLAFWLAILSAAGMYAAVALAPKLTAWLEYRDRWRVNQGRLVRLERKVDHLQRVTHALEHDPGYAAELARMEWNASRPGEERIPVDEDLTLQAVRPESPQAATRGPSAALPWYAPAVQRVAGDERLRRWMLAAAAAIVVFAFTCLHPSPFDRFRQPGGVVQKPTGCNPWSLRRGLGRLGRRYRRPPQDDDPRECLTR